MNTQLNNFNCATTLLQHIDEFLIKMQVQHRKSIHTIEAYKADIMQFTQFMHHHLGFMLDISDLSQLSLIDFRSYLSHLQATLNTTSVARKLSSLRSFFKYCVTQQLINQHNLDLIKLRKINTPLPRPIDYDNLLKILQQATKTRQQQWLQQRDYAIFILLYSCGIRISELVQLNYQDFIDVQQATHPVLKIDGKGNKARLVPILPITITAIEEYLSNIPLKFRHNKTQYNTPLFINHLGQRINQRSIQKTLQHIREHLQLDSSVTPHAMRHSFATHLLNEQVDLRSLQTLLGHESLAATQKYLKVETTKLQHIQNKYHPRNHQD